MPKKILVIDDEPDISELIRDCLSDKNFIILSALAGDLGIELAEKEKPDLILLDILLPKIGGLDCLKQIKQKSPTSVVVMLSGVKSEDVAKEAIRRGAYDFVAKPIDLFQFESTILKRLFPDLAS